MPLGIGAESIGTAYVRILADGDALDESVQREFAKAEPGVQQAGRKHGEAYNKGFEDETKRHNTIEDLAESIGKGHGRFAALGELLGSDLWDGLEGEFNVKLNDTDLSKKIVENLREGFASGAIDDIGKEIEKNFGKLIVNAEQDLDRLGGSSRRNGGFLRNLADDINGLGDSTARAFGKGSRNNFINFFGSFIGNVVSATSALPKLADKVGTFSSTLAKGEKSFAGLGEAFASVSEEGVALAPSLAGAGVAIAALVLILPTLVSILTLLGGVVVALAASLTFALAGALGVVGALILPLAASLGVLVAGVAAFNASGKSLSQTIQPLTDEFKELGKAAESGLFSQIGPTIDNITEAFKGLRPETKAVGSALADVGLSFSKGLAGPGFDVFLHRIDTFLPNAIRQLGSIAQNSLGGIGGLFTAAIPQAEKFLKFLDGATQSFDQFTNRPAGQQKLIDFFDRAGKSAHSLGDLTADLARSLGQLLSSAQPTGDTIIDHLDTKVRDFTAFLKANPDAVKNFFTDVGSFADGVGRATLGIIHLVDTLDSPQSRKQATAVFDAIAQGLEFTGKAFAILDDIGEPILVTLAASARLLALPFRLVADVIRLDFAGALSDVISIVGDLLGVLGHIGSALGKIPGVPDLGKPFNAAADSVQRLRDKLDGKEIKPQVDFTDIEKLDAVSKTTDESLRILLGLPKITPQVGTGQIKGAQTDVEVLTGRMRDFANLPVSEVQIDKREADAAKLSELLLRRSIEDTAGVASKNTTIKINAAQIRVARDISDALLTALRGIFALKDKTIHITTIHGDKTGTSAAKGGIFGRMAAGGIAAFQQYVNGITAGEAGREAIVPLDKPLGEVDPSVRYLSAVAQGFNPGGSRTVNNNLTVITPTKDPVAAAKEAVNELVNAGGYES